MTKGQANSDKQNPKISTEEVLHVEVKASSTDISQTAKPDFEKVESEKLAEQWLAENKQAFQSWNAYVEKFGLPLEKYRTF
jgi:antitoxin CcdA